MYIHRKEAINDIIDIIHASDYYDPITTPKCLTLKEQNKHNDKSIDIIWIVHFLFFLLNETVKI